MDDESDRGRAASFSGHMRAQDQKMDVTSLVCDPLPPGRLPLEEPVSSSVARMDNTSGTKCKGST